MDGKELAVTTKAKYLGVNISNNLSWNHHIDCVCKKANNTTAFLRRNLSSCPVSIKDKCYKMMVRPQVEYASTVWDPHTKKNIDKVEAVQRRAARFVTSNYSTTSSVTAMIDRLEWETLCQRRARANATMMYRVVHSLVAIQLPPQFSQTGAATRGHQHRYRIPFCRTCDHLQRIVLPVYHQGVEPAARTCHRGRVLGILQEQDPWIRSTIDRGSAWFYQTTY